MPKKQSKPQQPPNFSLLQDLTACGYTKIVGVDEVGRGALAGPIVVAAIELPIRVHGVDDSKKLSRPIRSFLFEKIRLHAAQLSFGLASNQEIDEFGVTEALHRAYDRALERVQFDILLTDHYSPRKPSPHIRSVKGDRIFYSVAAASIMAKVYRDQLMTAYGQLYPAFEWDANVGYGTQTHLSALTSHGKTSLHRELFLKK